MYTSFYGSYLRLQNPTKQRMRGRANEAHEVLNHAVLLSNDYPDIW